MLLDSPIHTKGLEAETDNVSSGIGITVIVAVWFKLWVQEVFNRSVAMISKVVVLVRLLVKKDKVTNS